jgi:dynein light intermediate chain 2, cytosolic
MEYTFGKRTKGQDKDVAHIYELAGETLLSSLLNIVITEHNLHLSSFVIVVDLTRPEQAIEIIEHFINHIGKKIKELMDNLDARGSKRPAAMKNYAWKRYGTTHPDESFINPFPSPLLIMGTKYDHFKNLESERKKLFCKTIRYLAHIHGASVMFHTSLDESLNSKAKQLLSYMAFKTVAPKTINVDHTKPLMITAGQDTLSQIGNPPSLFTDTVGKQSLPTMADWKQDFSHYFPNNISSILY